MGKFYVYTSRASKGARALAKALDGKRIKTGLHPDALVDTVINWGDSSCPTTSSKSYNKPVGNPN
jgi:hypothetical protein